MNSSSAPRQQILLVDDEEDALIELAESLENEGFVCFTGRRQKLSATPDLSGRVLPCLITNSALKNAPISRSVC
ncbi:MAG: hypothetical protein ACRESF_20805, partial [Pseudomonas sp.]